MTKAWKTPYALLVAVAGTLMAWQFQAAAQTKEPIKIGFVIAESGYMSPNDTAGLKAAMIAIDDINAAGGLLGRRIETVVRDMKTDPALSAKLGAEVSASGIDLLITTADYDLGGPAALAAKQKNIIAFSGAGDPKMGVQGVGWQSFSANGAAQVEGITMAEWAYAKKDIRKVFVLQDDILEYTKSACAGFTAAWRKLAGDAGIVGMDEFQNGDPSIAAQITRIKQTNPAPEAIFMCSGPPGGASAVRQMRAAGIDIPILNDVGMTDDYWMDATPNLSNFYVPTLMSIFGDDPSPEVQAFAAKFKQKYGVARVANAYAPTGYVAIQAWSLAVKRAGTVDAKAVVAELEKFRDEPLLLGPTTYTSDMHIQLHRPLLIMEVQHGQHHSLYRWPTNMIPDKKLLFRLD